jgi:chemotaxis methyl-accepting protein methylase
MKPEHEIAEFVAARTGMELKRGGIDRALHSAVLRRQKELRLAPRAYLMLLQTESSGELERLVNSITVGYTWFFRDPGQLATVEALIAAAPRGRVRVWIPGCSTGEDAYSVSLIAGATGRDVEILATDVNSRSLEHARRAIYGAWSVRELDARFATQLKRRPDGLEVAPDVRQRVSLARHNLIERPPVTSDGAGWDVILCRNVLIYFDRDVALRVLDTLARSLAPGGHLVLGASEVVCEVPRDLDACYVAGRLVLRRRDPEHALAAVPPLQRDWLVPPPRADHSARLLSVFPVPATRISDTVPKSVPAPSDAERALAAGHQLIESGDAAGAVIAYADAIRADRTRADAHMYAGVARYLAGDVELAMHDLRAALFLDDTLWPAALYLGLCHENSGHPAEALLAFEHVVRIDDRGGTARRSFEALFDTWREDLCALARQRVRGARGARG